MNINTLVSQVTNKPQPTFKQLVDSPVVKQRFQDVLKDKAPMFLANLVQLANTDLKGVEPNSIFSGALISASLDLPLNKSLGFAYLIKYGQQAQFQLGYKGLVQLAQRSGQYKRLNVIEVYKGELVSYNRLTEEIEIDFKKKESEEVIGYVAYFKLINGFEKTVYWSKEEVDNHAKKYSKTYNFKNGVWKLNYDAMAKKTVLKNMLSKWGILSIDLQKAIESDQAVINKSIEDTTEIKEEDLIYIDNENGGVENGAFNEITSDIGEVSNEVEKP